MCFFSPLFWKMFIIHIVWMRKKYSRYKYETAQNNRAMRRLLCELNDRAGENQHEGICICYMYIYGIRIVNGSVTCVLSSAHIQPIFVSWCMRTYSRPTVYTVVQELCVRLYDPLRMRSEVRERKVYVGSQRELKNRTCVHDRIVWGCFSHIESVHWKA